jgi:hypothetical protein
VASTKSRGDRGSPHLTPLLQLRYLPRTSFSKTEVVAELSMPLVHYSHLSLKPRCLIISRIAECSIISNALVKSSMRMTICLFDC